MMQDHVVALSSMFDIHNVLSFLNGHHISMNSQRKMLCYNMNHILRDEGLC